LELIAALMLPAMAACSGVPARSEAQQRDSPPPKPMPAPQVVARKPTDPVVTASTVAGLFPVPTPDAELVGCGNRRDISETLQGGAAAKSRGGAVGLRRHRRELDAVGAVRPLTFSVTRP